MGNMSITERIKDLIEYMGLTEYSFSQFTSIDKSNLSKMLNGQRTIGDAIINKIVLATNCNKEWLKDGKGLMFDIPYKGKESSFVSRVIDLLQDRGMKPQKLSELTGFDFNELQNILNGNASNHTLDLAFVLKDQFRDINLDWLLKGESNTEKTPSYIETQNTNDKPYTMTNEPISEYLPTSNFKLLPVHSFDVVGGINNQECDTMGYIMGYMPFVNAKDGDISVLVTGNSMYPTYPAGSYVQIRKIDYWREFLEFGQVHIIELMDDRRLIKEVRKGSDKKHLRLISHNENFDEVEISTDFVRSVWLVLAKYEKSVL